MSKKMTLPGCDNCADTACSLKSCSRCKLVKYCGKPCQSQHWKSGHKKRCVAVADRKPFAAAEDASVPKCVICLEAFHEGEDVKQLMEGKIPDMTNVKFRCGHQFHYDCALEAALNSRACVICRADILAGKSFQQIAYMHLLILVAALPNEDMTSHLDLAVTTLVCKIKLGELATVVEKEFLDIKDLEIFTEIYVRDQFFFALFRIIESAR
jgi:hypothetical protein